MEDTKLPSSLTESFGGHPRPVGILRLEKEALGALFELTAAGALVGVESSGWNTCGITLPSLIVLDPATKTVRALVPSETGC